MVLNVRAMRSTPPNALPWLLLSAAVIVLDQVTKALVVAHVLPGQRLTLVPHLLDLTLAYNTGAAFSFLAGAGGWQRWLFGLLAVGISLALAAALARVPRGAWRTALPFALIIGGALGNLVDRLRLGHVVDFILVHWRNDWYYPAFNAADSAITVGAALLVGFAIWGDRHDKS